jgi:hypothetical protein
LTVPPSLVKAAKSRSVPTARMGLMPKPKMSSGVIKEPPPTPVRPTTKPTKKPERINARSVMEMDCASQSIKSKLLFCCWLIQISICLESI